MVADLHLEKGSAFATRGVLLPPYDTAATLARLARLVEHYAPRIVIALGDSFHDDRGPLRMSDLDRIKLKGLQRGRDWVWIAGNHDPDLPRTSAAVSPIRWRSARSRSATSRRNGRRTARSPGICIRSRGSRSAAAPSAGAVSRPTAGDW